MVLKFKNNASSSRASAKVVDGKLILSFPDAATPVVWTMDVAKAKASAMEVLPKGDSGEHTLTLKSAAGEVIEVATFPSKDDALEGLMITADALENAQGAIRGSNAAVANDSPSPAQSKPKAQKKPGETKRNVMGLVASLLFLGVMIMVWSFIMPDSYFTGERNVANNNPSSSLAAASADPQNSSGVPVSADAFLGGQ